MSLKDLPKSLVETVTQIVTKSFDQSANQKKKIISEGLKSFGVKSVADLSEEQRKMLYSWAQKRLDEASCGCSETSDMVKEDDMPGDEVFHKNDDENAEKKKDLGENADKEESVTESISIKPHEVAVNGAVGCLDANTQKPVHADVLRDSSPVDGTHEYRLFVQFNTNTMPVIVPPVVLPGAPTIDALRDVVEGLPFFCDVCERALSNASDVPHERPEHQGSSVVAEAYLPTPYDKKVMLAIKNVLKTQNVDVDDFVSGGIHAHEFTAKVDDLYVTVREEPSKRMAGKSVWRIRQELGDAPIDDVLSDPYPPGVELKAIQALKQALAKHVSGTNTKFEPMLDTDA